MYTKDRFNITDELYVGSYVVKLDMSNNAYNVVDNSFKVFLAYIDLSSITSVKRRQPTWLHCFRVYFCNTYKAVVIVSDTTILGILLSGIKHFIFLFEYVVLANRVFWL